MIQENIQSLVEGKSLSTSQSRLAMEEIMNGQATNAQIAAFLTALRMKGETVEELVSFAKVMRERCIQIRPCVEGRLVDTCGTGGDKIKTFNISTTAAFVAAGAGIAIAKHGNRSVTSKSGSADVLEQLRVNLNVPPQVVKASMEQLGIGFIFAPAFHPAMKYAMVPRKEIGIRTIFNLLGPLTNPACANAQLLGVYDSKLTEPCAKALYDLGCEEAIVVNGLDGLDEISTVGLTSIAHLKNGDIRVFKSSPEDFGVRKVQVAMLQGGTPLDNAKLLYEILNGKITKGTPKRDIVLINAAAAIIVGGKAETFIEGIELAAESIDSGKALRKLELLVKATDGDHSRLKELNKIG
jgi:anthranilate phosphoribosyltransferase